MSTHDIEPMKYGGAKSDDYVTGWNDCYAAIEVEQCEPLTCDECGAKTDDPWHTSRDENRHVHMCDGCHTQALEADRKRRGEPVARVSDDGFIVETGLGLAPGTLLYTSPQSAEPVSCAICFEDEPHTGTCGSNDPRALCNRAAEPVKVQP